MTNSENKMRRKFSETFKKTNGANSSNKDFKKAKTFAFAEKKRWRLKSERSL